MSSTGLNIMKKITGKHLLCLFLLALPVSWAEDMKKDVRKTENNTVWNQGKNRRLFARRKISTPQESHIPRHKTELMTPARRCSRLMESCSSHTPCCDPCASCRCRLFNTICHCWRMNPMCLKRT
ncbi:agouti-signaling protein 2b [Scomber scombrus]|uniref:agouti-signaling protein 2b n=1 Tax=Scomber scombrus TaxID=13677 RepID=UPI002DD9295A|nr:agouti-signaling protein 2b [Scomber scombrus]